MKINYEVKFTAEEKVILSKFTQISCKDVPCAKCPFYDEPSGICFKGQIRARVEEFLNED